MSLALQRLFFNAHCHLEYSHLRGAIPPGLPFAEWLERMIAAKRATTREEMQSGVAAGLNELLATGTRALLDIESMWWSAEAVRAFQIPAISFVEMIAPDPLRGEDAVRGGLARQVEAGPAAGGFNWGLAPHAPYTTSDRLMRAAAGAASVHDQWLCIHAAETAEEVSMMTAGRGALREFLDSIGAVPSDWRPPGLRPVEWLANLNLLGPRTLLVHCNEITGAEIRLIAESGTRVVVCPGTHLYFARGEFPLRRLLEGGVDVYLGTDSLASNEALDMRREVELAKAMSPGIEPQRVEGLADAACARDFGLEPARM